MWIAEPVKRDGGFEDNEEPFYGASAPDWICWLNGHGGQVHLNVRFSRDGVDRGMAEEIVARVLRGLNA